MLEIQGSYRQVLVKFKDFSRTSKSLSNSFQGLNVNENTDLNVKVYFRNARPRYWRHLYWKISSKLLCLYLVQHMLHQIKAQQFYTDLGLYQQCLVIQKGEFRDFSRPLSDFPVLFKAKDFSRSH